MNPNHFHKLQSKSGLAMVLLMVILVIATAIGIWGLTSSRSSLLKAGSRKFSTELTYQAEQGLQKAVGRIQTIARAGTDQVAVANNDSTASGKTGGNYTSKNINFLVNPTAPTPGGLCAETSCAGTPNPACSGFDALQNFDVININVICNFLGVVDTSNQVTIVRKNDLVAGSETFAILLVNSIARDKAGRMQAMQGVVVVPYIKNGAVYSSTGTPYMASSKAVTD